MRTRAIFRAVSLAQALRSVLGGLVPVALQARSHTPTLLQATLCVGFLQELHSHSNSEVPVILADILRWLATRGLQHPDVFLAPSSRGEPVLSLKQLYDSGHRDPLKHIKDARVVRPTCVGCITLLD